MKDLLVSMRKTREKTFSPSNVTIIMDDADDFFCDCSGCEDDMPYQESFVWHPKRKF